MKERFGNWFKKIFDSFKIVGNSIKNVADSQDVSGDNSLYEKTFSTAYSNAENISFTQRTNNSGSSGAHFKPRKMVISDPSRRTVLEDREHE